MIEGNKKYPRNLKKELKKSYNLKYLEKKDLLAFVIIKKNKLKVIFNKRDI